MLANHAGGRGLLYTLRHIATRTACQPQTASTRSLGLSAKLVRYESVSKRGTGGAFRLSSFLPAFLAKSSLSFHKLVNLRLICVFLAAQAAWFNPLIGSAYQPWN
jgi:hypothetical protein